MTTRALWLVLLLAGSPVLAQANICGAGKNCKVKTLTTTGVNAAGTPVCISGASSAIGITNSSGAMSVSSMTTQCTAAFGAAIMTASGVTGVTSGLGYNASVAFAAFPTCNAAASGRQLFDSTGSGWRYCVNGAGWRPVGPVMLADDLTTYFPGLALINVPMARILAPRQFFGAAGSTSAWGTFSVRLDSATTLAPGVGAGAAVFTVYNLTDAAATTATVTVPCASAAGTVTDGSTDTTVALPGSQPKEFELRLTADGCGTLPTVNLTWGYTVLPAGS